jgi:hypothetical protein
MSATETKRDVRRFGSDDDDFMIGSDGVLVIGPVAPPHLDYSPDQERDAHGRFGSGTLGIEKGAGGRIADAAPKGDSTKEKTYWQKEDDKNAAHHAALAKLAAATPPSPPSTAPVGTADHLYALGEKLNALHEGKEHHDDWGVSTYKHEAFSTPERKEVLDTVKNIVEHHSGIAQKYPVDELRINQMMAAHGTFEARHEEAMLGRLASTVDRAAPPTEHMGGRITIDPEIHMQAIHALQMLGDNKIPDPNSIGGLHTYVHEMCHSTSPMQLETKQDVREGKWVGVKEVSAYRGHGAIIEEVTTEVMARGVMAKILAETPGREGIVSAHSQIVEPRAAKASSYQPAINWTMAKIRTAVSDASPSGSGLTSKSVFASRILGDATHAYRSATPPAPFTKDQAAAHFAKCIGDAAVKAHPDGQLHAGEVAESVRLQFRQIENGPDADILQRFDAETMTRFDAVQSVWTVPRNDIAAAMAISNPSPDEMSVLLQLQDNPELLLQALAKRSP